MADEKKSGPVIEMNVWFIAFLLVVIFATVCILKLNNDLKAAQEKYDTLQTQYQILESNHNAMRDTVGALAAKVALVSPNELRNELEKISGQIHAEYEAQREAEEEPEVEEEPEEEEPEEELEEEAE